MDTKLKALCDKITEDKKEYCRIIGWDWEVQSHGMTAHCHEGKKYWRVDVGDSGAYMVDCDGNIFGIKAYGVIHRGHSYGTLDTIGNYFWGDYRAKLKL